MASSQDQQQESIINLPLQEDKKKMKVTFDDVIHQRPTLHLNDYSLEEVDDCWITPEEMNDTIDRIVKVAQRMASGKKPKRGSSYRGLENATVEGEAEYYYNIQDAVESVLCEQDRQNAENIHDEDLIAEASELYTEVCTEKALRRGKSDAREAKRAYRRMEDIYNPCNEGSSSSFSYVDEVPVPVLRTGNDLQVKKLPAYIQELQDVLGQELAETIGA